MNLFKKFRAKQEARIEAEVRKRLGEITAPYFDYSRRLEVVTLKANHIHNLDDYHKLVKYEKEATYFEDSVKEELYRKLLPEIKNYIEIEVSEDKLYNTLLFRARLKVVK